MTARIDHAVTTGTFSLDGGTWEVDNNVWVVGDDSECIVVDAGHEAAPILEAVGVRTVQLCRLYRVDVDFASAGLMEDQLRGLVLPSGEALVVDGVEWSDKAHIKVAVSAGAEDELNTALATLSAGTLTAMPVGERWVG